jgi:hypothetical protein
MNLSAAVQQLEISVSDFKAICQALDVSIIDNSIGNESFEKIKVFVTACKERKVTYSEGIQELLRLKNEVQTQQNAMGSRFNLDDFFTQRIGVNPHNLAAGSYHYDLYQLLLKSQSISQVGYALFREAFLRQTHDLIMNGAEETEIKQNQTIEGFGIAFENIELQFEQNFLGNSVNWGESEHPILTASTKKPSLPSTQKTVTQSPPSSKK